MFPDNVKQTIVCVFNKPVKARAASLVDTVKRAKSSDVLVEPSVFGLRVSIVGR